MSWSKPIPKSKKDDAAGAIDNLALEPNDQSASHAAQLAAAKRGAHLLLATIPGPFIDGYLSGHGDGTNDSFSVNLRSVNE